MTAYCVKCKKKVEISNPVKVTLRNGKNAKRGKCAKCGTTVYRFE